MSLIEQAAKRLEELRRAGADLSDSPVDARPEPDVTRLDQPPTPAAIVSAHVSRALPSSV